MSRQLGVQRCFPECRKLTLFLALAAKLEANFSARVGGEHGDF